MYTQWIGTYLYIGILQYECSIIIIYAKFKINAITWPFTKALGYFILSHGHDNSNKINK